MYVIATALTGDVDYVRRLGADEVIDATTQACERQVRDVDAIFDTVGGEPNAKAYQLLRKGGMRVSLPAPVDDVRHAFPI